MADCCQAKAADEKYDALVRKIRSTIEQTGQFSYPSDGLKAADMLDSCVQNLLASNKVLQLDLASCRFQIDALSLENDKLKEQVAYPKMSPKPDVCCLSSFKVVYIPEGASVTMFVQGMEPPKE